MCDNTLLSKKIRQIKCIDSNNVSAGAKKCMYCANLTI